jgi:hypothetical protein
MKVGWRGVVAIACAVGAAVFWAVDLALWQPLAERPGEFGEVYGENNTYWARDLRFSAIVALALGVLLAGRGGRLSRWVALTAGAAWAAADLMLDRADVDGGGAAVVLAVSGAVAATAVTATALLRGAAEPADRPLVMGAAIAACLAPLVGGIESPTDTETALTPAAMTLGVLFAVLTLALALAATPAPSTGRSVTAAAVAVVAASGLVLVRTLEPGTQIVPMLVLGGLLLGGVALLVNDWPGGRPSWQRQFPQQLILLMLYPALTYFILIVTITVAPIGPWFTALAGNVAINSADSDVLYAVVGCAAGYTIGWLILAINGAPRSQPVEPAASVPTT